MEFSNEYDFEAIIEVTVGILNSLRCNQCNQWIGTHFPFEFNYFRRYRVDFCIINKDISQWDFRKIIIGNRIFCDCGQYLAIKLNQNQTILKYDSIILIR